MKQFSKMFLTYVVAGVGSLVLFSMFLHVDFWDNDIYLYKCFLYAAITAGLIAVLLVGVKKIFPSIAALELTPNCIFSASMLCLLALGFLSSTVIMPLDRSYTIYTLADMTDHREQIYTLEEIEDGFINVYIKDMQSTLRRVDEQVGLGNLIEVDGGYQISEKGMKLIQMYRFVDKIYPVDNKTSIYPNK